MTHFKVSDEAVRVAGEAVEKATVELEMVQCVAYDREVSEAIARAAIEAALPVMLTKVGYATVQRWKGIDSAINYDFDYIGDLPDGTYCVYATKESK